MRGAELLHQRGLLAADIRDPHICFADLDAENQQHVIEQLIDGGCDHRKRVGKRRLNARQASEIKVEEEKPDIQIEVLQQ